MNPLILEKKPIAINELKITATITADDCNRIGLSPEHIGTHTFGLHRWSRLTGKAANSIKAMHKAEIESRADGKPDRDWREIIGLEKVTIHREGSGIYNTRRRDIERFSSAANYFIYGKL